MDFNVALRLAYQDIIGNAPARTAAVKSVSHEYVLMDQTGLKQPQHGRYGNVIYLSE